MDKIIIATISSMVRIGVTEKERSQPQKIDVDVELELDLEAAGKFDEPSLTVDYERVTNEIRRRLAAGSYRLLEALAHEVCRSALSDSRVGAVRTRARKYPRSMAGKAESVAVELFRRS